MIRIIGAVLLVAGCSGFGFSIAAANRKEAGLLRRLIRAIQEMEWELKYALTELPELCLLAGRSAGGNLKAVFEELGEKLDRREAVEISGCLNGILLTKRFPQSVHRNLKQLGQTLGRYDLEAQLQGLEVTRLQCQKDLKTLEEGSAQRMRSYQTIAVCAGVVLAVLLV